RRCLNIRNFSEQQMKIINIHIKQD
ncbi:hypothetical protein CEXT_234381, partial [Caerostris extrusa]